MERYDVAVIGAGPSGCMAAKYSAKRGATTLLLEEHKSIGYPVQCAGLLGLKALEEAEVGLGSFAVMPMRGAKVFSPKGANFSFQAKEERAWVVERRLFDRALAVEATLAGARLRLGSPVTAIRLSGKDNILTVGGAEVKDIRASVVISAEGVKATLARARGIPRPSKILSGAQVTAPFHVEDPLKVELHLGAAPGLFAWVIPTGQKEARIGLCAKETGCLYLRAFLKSKIISRRLLGSPLDLVVGGLPLGPPPSTVADGMIAVGDVVGQVKPTSGGGVYPGLVCAKIAGIVAAASAQERDCSKERLSEYEWRWRARLGRELEVGMKLNEILCSMTAYDLEEMVSYLASRPELLEIVEEHGDVDRPSRLLARMLPKMGLWGLKLGAALTWKWGKGL
jgi:geranylgeranyl reductase family protein